MQQAAAQRPAGRPIVPRRDAHSGVGSGGASPRRRLPPDWSASSRVTCCQENCRPEVGAGRGAAVRDGAGLALRELGRGQGKRRGERREKNKEGMGKEKGVRKKKRGKVKGKVEGNEEKSLAKLKKKTTTKEKLTYYPSRNQEE